MLVLLSSVVGLLLLGALVLCLMASTGRAQLWIAVLLVILANLISFAGMRAGG
jgi:hypothetical protein